MEKAEHRQKKIKVRKNILVTLFITIFLWISVAAIIYFTDPAKTANVYLFFIFTFLALLFTLSTIFINTRRGLIYSIGLILFLILRYFGIGNYINAALLLGICITADLFTSRL